MNQTPLKIVVDAMGGDFAPKSEVAGGGLALQASPDIHVCFIGDADKIQVELQNNPLFLQNDISSRFEVIDTKEVINMHDDPIVALKTKKNSSMMQGIHLLKNKQADAYISAGNTGATMTLSTIILGCIKGVSRPTIGAFFPTAQGKPVFLLDIGATIECRSRYLFEYAVMGSVFSSSIHGISRPLVGLLNVGEEETKGTKELLDAHAKLKSSELNFLGNIEGGDILSGKTDIVVADGYLGNVLLKFAESFTTVIGGILNQIADKYKGDSIKLGIIDSIMAELVKGFDADQYGGTPLLGVNGTVIIGHGNSSPVAIKNMILSAKTCVEKNICANIESQLANISF